MAQQSHQTHVEGVADTVQIALRKRRLVQLSVLDPLLDDLLDDPLNLAPSRALQRADGRLDSVGQHDDGGLLGLRPLALIPVALLGDRVL